MMRDVKINDLELLKYCETAIAGKDIPEFPDEFPHDRCVCFGQYGQDGQPRWVVALYDFKEGHDCIMDVALNIKGLFSPSLFKMMGRVVFDYIFNQAKLVRCSAHIRVSNKASIRISKAWGMKQEGIIRSGYKTPPIEDKVLFGMLKTECVWI